MRRSWTPSIVLNDRVVIDNFSRRTTSGNPTVYEALQALMPLAVHFQTSERTQRWDDLYVSVAISFAFALPAILGASVYLATHALLRAS
jgi:hypothetical protein